MQTKSLIVTYGLPGSGKSTWADAFCAQDPRLRRAFGRDRIRRLLGTLLGRSRTADDERRVTEKQRELISDWLERGAGMVAVLDETSINTPIGAWAEWLDATYPLPQPEPWQLQAEAERGLQFIRYQHRFAVADLSWVPLRTCLARNAARPRETRVPYAEMRRMYRAMRPLPAGVRSFRADPSRGRRGVASAWWPGDQVRHVPTGRVGTVVFGNEREAEADVCVRFGQDTDYFAPSEPYLAVPELELIAAS